MGIVTIDSIPVYQALVDSAETGMMRISLVDDPAVQSNFLAFSNQQKRAAVPQVYAVQDEDKHLVLGCVMRADFPIYRRDPQPDGTEFEYYIIYKPDTIRTMAEKYLAENRQNLVNLMHQEGTDQDGVQMVQYFIKGNGLAPEGFDAIADGSLFAEFHITNQDVWEAVKAGTYKGFSLEGIFDLTPEKDAASVEEIVDALDGIFGRILPKQTYNKMKKKGILARLAAMLVEMGNVSTDKGILAWDGDAELKAGDEVFIEDADGNRTPAADGEYTTGKGKVIVVADGKVQDIRNAGTPAPAEPAPAEPTPAAAEDETQPDVCGVKTDKGTLYWMGDDDLKAGYGVFVGQEGKEGLVPAPDGEYIAEDGTTIVVTDGKVSEIKVAAPAEPAAPAENTPAVENAFQRIAQAFQETYNDKMNALIKAIENLGFSWPWLVEAGEEYCIASIYNDNGEEVFFRFNIVEWKEDGSVVLENGVKVVPAFVTPEEKEAAEENFAALVKENGKLKAQVETLKRTPAAKPAHQEFTGTQVIEGKTGNKGLDRLARVMSAK